jgi:glycosyltransferase involved in cell wall biosynthesis
VRILFVSRNFFPSGVMGGAQTSVMYLAKAIQAQGHDVAVLSVDDQAHTGIHAPTGLMEFRLKLRNIYTRGSHSFPARTAWHLIDRLANLMEPRYSEVFESFRPDVILTNVMAGITPAIWRAARKAHTPIVHVVHDYYLTCYKSAMRKADKNCDRSCSACKIISHGSVRGAATGVSDVIYVSDFVRAVHEAEGVFPSTTRAHIIHGAYEPEGIIPARNGPVEPGVLTLGFFGRLAPEKGVVELIESLQSLPNGSWKLRVGGGGDSAYVEEVVRAAHGLPVEVLGVRPPTEFYSSIDAIIVSSLWNDPAPRVVYEAGMHGVIPIVSNRGGLPQLVGYGSRGLIFDPLIDGSLVGAIKSVVVQPELMENFRQTWQEAYASFLPASVAAETIEIFEKAIRSYAPDRSGDGAA